MHKLPRYGEDSPFLIDAVIEVVELLATMIDSFEVRNKKESRFC